MGREGSCLRQGREGDTRTRGPIRRSSITISPNSSRPFPTRRHPERLKTSRSPCRGSRRILPSSGSRWRHARRAVQSDAPRSPSPQTRLDRSPLAVILSARKRLEAHAVGRGRILPSSGSRWRHADARSNPRPGLTGRTPRHPERPKTSRSPCRGSRRILPSSGSRERHANARSNPTLLDHHLPKLVSTGPHSPSS